MPACGDLCALPWLFSNGALQCAMAELTKRQMRAQKRRRMRRRAPPSPPARPPAALAPPPQLTAEERQLASSPARQTAAGAGAGAVPQPEQERETKRSQSTCAEPGSSFCWGPALQGSTSPSSSRSSTLGQADRARCEVRQPPTPPPPCARTSTPPPAPRTDPAPSGRLAYCPRAACTLASSPPPLLPLCAGARVCLLTPDAASPPMPPRPGAADAPSPRCRP